MIFLGVDTVCFWVLLGVPGLVVQGARRVVFVLRLEVGHYVKCMRVSNFLWGWAGAGGW